MKRIRTTISIPSGTYEIYKNMSNVTGLSVSRVIGDWLDSTSDAAAISSKQIEEIKNLPKQAIHGLIQPRKGGGKANG